ncbi:Hypothetical protein SCC1_2914 [Pectobacterium versatile]|nr:Hypothetical protein SCC1_2914 [Pectobacterium versatile]
MLKVIAQDFIKPEYIEIVMPLYRELVEKPDRSRCVSPMSFLSIRKIRGILPLSKPGRIEPHWIFTARPNTSSVWFR